MFAKPLCVCETGKLTTHFMCFIGLYCFCLRTCINVIGLHLKTDVSFSPLLSKINNEIAESHCVLCVYSTLITLGLSSADLTGAFGVNAGLYYIAPQFCSDLVKKCCLKQRWDRMMDQNVAKKFGCIRRRWNRADYLLQLWRSCTLSPSRLLRSGFGKEVCSLLCFDLQGVFMLGSGIST